ncbi:MAG: DUF3806 domain-containing protein [Daejeonella sp.]
MSFLKKMFSKNKEYTEKVTSQSLPAELKLEELTDGETNYINTNIALANKTLKDLGLKQDEDLFDPTRIEQAIKAWFQNDLQAKLEIDVNSYSNSLAAGWGKYLEEKLGMTWQVITDEFGTEIGLYHKQNHVTLFPFNLTAKAFNKKDFGLLSVVTDKTKKVINDR